MEHGPWLGGYKRNHMPPSFHTPTHPISSSFLPSYVASP